MSDEFWFERQWLWEEAQAFAGWTYGWHFAAPTYQASWLDRAVAMDVCRVNQTLYRKNQTRRINCSMFTNAVIIGAAMRGDSKFDWTVDMHKASVNDPPFSLPDWSKPRSPPDCPPVRAYVAAKMAKWAEPGERPARGDWCICQTTHHSFFVVDFDEDTQFCLTLEAQTFDDERREFGFVGHRGRLKLRQVPWGFGLRPTPPDLNELPKEQNRDLVSWSALKVVRFARLNLRDSELSMPLDRHASPLRVYFNTEHLNNGGLFPLGSYRNIHTGVHLVPHSADERKVRAMAPGEIVALRLPSFLHPASAASTSTPPPSKDEQDINELCNQLMGSDNGFVLLRHTVAKPNATGAASNGAKKKDDTHVFYSLYFHLRRPRITNGAVEGLDADVVWLRRLYRRYGSVTILDPKHPAYLSRRWLSEDGQAPASGKAELVAGGKYPVFTEDLKTTETLELDGPPAALALLRPPEDDLKTFYAELEAGHVVTLAAPVWTVQKGEVIGVINETSGFGSGILHWEVLTPGEGSMKQVLTFLNGLLPEASRLPGDFFSEVKESQEDNYFESKGDGTCEELETIVGKLPEADKNEREALAHGYPPKVLLDLFKVKQPAKDVQQLAFDTHQDAPKGFFRGTLRIANGAAEYKDLVPDGTHPLTVTCSGGGFTHSQQLQYKAAKGAPVDLPITIPGGTREVEISTPPNLFLDPGGSVSLRAPSELKNQRDFLVRLGKARLRNTVITHLNEWTSDGLSTTFKVREQQNFPAKFPWVGEEGKRDEKLRASVVKAIRWWGVNTPSGPTHQLFGDGDGQLPPNAKTENVHPVTLIWLLQLLERAKAVEFRVPQRWKPDDANRVAFAGIEGVLEGRTQRKVGEHLGILVLQEVEPSEDEVRVRALLTPKGKEARTAVSGLFKNGVSRLEFSGQVWGTLALSLAENPDKTDTDAQTAAKSLVPPGSAVDARSVEVIAPELESMSTPKQMKDDFVALLSFKRGLPAELEGWVVFRKWVDPKSPAAAADPGTKPSHSILFRARPRLTFVPPKTLKIEGGLIIGLPPNLQLSPNFGSSEYLKGAKNPARLSLNIVSAMQALRDSSPLHGLSPSGLTADGLGLDFTVPANKGESLSSVWKSFDEWYSHTATAIAAKYGATLRTEELDPESRKKTAPKVHLKDNQDATAGGDLELRFSVADAVFAATELAEGEKGLIDVGVGVRVFNGATWQHPGEPMIVPADSPRLPLPSDWAEVSKETIAELPRVWAPAPIKLATVPHVVSARFEHLHFEPGDKAKPRAQVIVELAGGDEAYWKKAEPGLSLNESPLKSARVPSQGRQLLTASFLIEEHRQVLEFKVSWKAAKFLGKNVAANEGEALELQGPGGETASSYDNTATRAQLRLPEGRSLEITANQDKEVSLILQTTGVFSSQLLEVVRADGKDAPLDSVTYAPVAKTLPDSAKKRKVRALGQVDRTGAMSITLGLLHFPEYTDGGRVTFKVLVRDRHDKRLGEVEVDPIQVTITPAEQLKPPQDPGGDIR